MKLTAKKLINRKYPEFSYISLFFIFLIFLFIVGCGFEPDEPAAVFDENSGQANTNGPNEADDDDNDSIVGGLSDVADDEDMKVHGFNFGPYLNDNPLTNTEIATLLDVIAPYTYWIRTYGVSDELSQIPALAAERGIKVAVSATIIGAWADDEREIENLISLIGQGDVNMAVIGGEALSRGDITAAKLIEYINRVKATGVLTTTNDTWIKLIEHPEVIKACDVIMANFYPFWEGMAVEGASASLAEDFRLFKLVVETISPGKRVIIGETGWPSQGESTGQAVPSYSNAARFFREFVEWARMADVEYFYFEAFDEPWKEDYEGSCGPYWGVWDSKMEIKPEMLSTFK